MADILKPPCAHPGRGQKHGQVIELQYRQEDDDRQDGRDDREGGIGQHEIPELGPAHPAVHIEIMLGDGAAEIFENRLRIHDATPFFDRVFGVSGREPLLGAFCPAPGAGPERAPYGAK